MKIKPSALPVFILGIILYITPAAAENAGEADPPAGRRLTLETKLWEGDLDQMVERRFIRVLVPYSRTLFFTDKGRERGITLESIRDFEAYLNKKYKTRKRPITVFVIPTTRDRLLSGIVEGLGDIAAGNLTITPERQQIVDFVPLTSEKQGVSEIVVTGPGGPQIASVDDLAGKNVHVRRSSSYFESLRELNARFHHEGRSAVTITKVPDELEDEDMMEMVNAGLLDTIIVDEWKARVWAQIVPKIKLHPEAAIRRNGLIGWAIRKESPLLRGDLEAFFASHLHQQGVIVSRYKKYMKQIKQLHNPKEKLALQRFERTLSLFQKYGSKYRFDPLMLVAQGFQESRLDQEARSPRGAIGIMQILPATGAEINVGGYWAHRAQYPCRCQIHGLVNIKILQRCRFF
jgi:membrane-bound lytic murein transglycosylase MltF